MRVMLPSTGGSKCLVKALFIVLLGSSVVSADERLSNWVGEFEPCNRSSELLKHDHMDIGVWLNTSNMALAEFRRGINFWTQI